MRSLLLVAGLSAAVAAPPTAVPTPPAADAAPDLLAPGPADAKYPFPQNRLLAADRLKQREAWYRAQWVGDFDRHADKAAAGYAKAREGVELAAACEARAGVRHAATADARDRALRAAAKANSPDPLVWVQHGRSLAGAVVDDRMTFVVESMAGKAYSPCVRAATYQKAAADALTNLKLDDRDAMAGRFLAALAELARSNDPTAAGCADELIVAAVQDDVLAATPVARYALVRPALAAEGVPERARQLAAGVAWQATAWEARGTGPLELVPANLKAAFKDGLAKAETNLTAAWTADPAQPQAAVQMIAVCRGRSHPREQMETWFRRALAADPDSHPACQAKLDFLRPEAIGGDTAEMLAFGRQCARAGSAQGWIPDILHEVHRHRRADGRADYWKAKGVWADLRAVYEPAVAAQPADRQVRTRYARVCLLCGHPEAADGHLKAINDKVWVADFDDPEKAAQLRIAIDRALAEKRTRTDDDK